MRTTSLALTTLLIVAAVAVGAIPTVQVPGEKILGESWMFKIDFRTPQRVVMDNGDGRQAYWVMLYTVTNTDNVAHQFIPSAIMFTDSGKVVNDVVVPEVVAKIKAQYGLAELSNSIEMIGPLKAGADEATDGIFIWPEVNKEMDRFKLFISGLSGEFIVREIPSAEEDGDPMAVVLRKTLQLDFIFPGDTVDLERDEVYLTGRKYIWR